VVLSFKYLPFIFFDINEPSKGKGKDKGISFIFRMLAFVKCFTIAPVYIDCQMCSKNSDDVWQEEMISFKEWLIWFKLSICSCRK